MPDSKFIPFGRHLGLAAASGLALVFSALSFAAARDEDAIPVRYCAQKVHVTGFSCPNEQALNVQILPLYKGLKWAVTSRWDDNPRDADLKMGELLDKYKYKGTFYVIGSGIGEDAERSLIARGHAVQSHSVTHPGLPGSSYNKIFEELLKSRIDIETRVDVPVNAFAFPGNGFTHPARPEIQWDIYRLLRRAGYVQIAWSGGPVPATMKGLSGDCELPGDGHPLEPWFSDKARDEALRHAEPNLSFTCHAWAYVKDNKWPILEAQLKAYAHNKDYWYCTQSEYGAYRFQYGLAKITNLTKGKDKLTFDLIRPSPIDAGATVPLSLKISGTNLNRAEVVLDGGKLTPDERGDATLGFSVPYPAREVLPHKIDAVVVTDSPVSSKKFPFLQASLALDNDDARLALQLKNSASALAETIVTYRLPMAAKPAVSRKAFPRVAEGQTLRDTLNVQWVDRSVRYLDGRSMFAAQVDFLQEEKWNRLYVVTYKELHPSDSVRSYPRGNFAILGPLTAEEGLNADLVHKVVKFPDAAYVLADGKKLSWQNPSADRGHAYCETVGAGANSLVTSFVDSPEKQEVTIHCFGSRAIWLNGAPVTAPERVVLEKGRTRLIVLTTGGLLWRIASTRTGERITNLTYTLPASTTDREVSIEESRPYRMFIKDWLICGPFPNPGKRPVKTGFDVDYLAGHGGEAAIDPKKDADVLWNEKRHTWLTFHSSTAKIDLFEFPPIKESANKEDILVYACCRLTAEKEQDVLIGLGSDDGYKLYLNHELLKTTRAFRGSAPDQEIVKAHLRKGVNLLLLKVDQDFGQYDFYVTLASGSLEPLDGIGVSLPE